MQTSLDGVKHTAQISVCLAELNWVSNASKSQSNSLFPRLAALWTPTYTQYGYLQAMLIHTYIHTCTIRKLHAPLCVCHTNFCHSYWTNIMLKINISHISKIHRQFIYMYQFCKDGTEQILTGVKWFNHRFKQKQPHQNINSYGLCSMADFLVVPFHVYE